ncbi:hypothetical protein A3A69_01175 [candidate division WWE3 bacterium RIFCSPLOWO2_01_FULL_37_15]|uniref:Non-canonical purine NTP pyrophosphatase n=1 Tax=candidate division WWE3 bacterium RIFCSPLOWO2_01_FULL_37_15 TaxID=1802622 RepID=A0A1F4UT86_UNCKA|nr:MAG: hypothetical protein A3A69_01175 [candidate division WWE3 bacterium RIFCSPLOWO2_01_FULL_37_15]
MICYVTGNQYKFKSACRRLLPFKIKLKQKQLAEIVEIQSDDIEKISLSKAQQAFQLLKCPLLVCDSAWYITSLNGYPGAYMSYMNKWFNPEDFLNLMKGKSNREVILEEVVTYIDKNGYKTFRHRKPGTILYSSKGNGIPSNTIISLSSTGKSIAECDFENIKASEGNGLWEDFGKWYSKQTSYKHQRKSTNQK